MRIRLATCAVLSLLVVTGATVDADPTPIGGNRRISGPAAISTDWDPAVAWSHDANEFLVVWEDRRNLATRGAEIYGRRIGADGLAKGPDFRISSSKANEYKPDVAWNSTADEFLVVWQDERGWDIYGHRVAGGGGPIGGDLRISASGGGEYEPAVAWNPTAKKYLIVWQDNRTPARGWEIYGRRMGGDGTLVGGEFRVSDSTATEGVPDLAFNAATNQYLVVWQDSRNQATRGWEVVGRRVGSTGTLLGSDFAISNAMTDETRPAVVWNATANQYGVVWEDKRNYATRGTEIYGRRVGPTGGLPGDEMRISTSLADDTRPAVTYNAVAGQFVVVWCDRRNLATRGTEIYGRRIGPGGTVGGSFRIGNSTTNEDYPAVVWNANDNQYLVVWHDDRNLATREWDIYGIRITGDLGG
jgi:hypothetical protein